MNFNNLETIPVICRQSSAGCALSCERCWFLKYRLGVVLRGKQIKTSATLGSIYHKLQQNGQDNIQETKAWVQQQQTALMEQVNRGEDIDGSIAMTASQMTELYHKAEVMATIFWEKYPESPYLHTLAKEQTIIIDMKDRCKGENYNLPIEGTIDKILEDENKNIWIRDHKTTGDNLDFLFNGIAWSLQARIYRFLVSEYYKQPVKGFIFDGIKVPGIKLCRTDEKNAKEWDVPIQEAYLRRVKDWYSEQEEENIRSKGILFTEPLYPPELLNVFRKMVDLSKRPIHPDNYDKDVTRRMCKEYRKPCVYIDLCKTSYAQWDELFETKYKFEKAQKVETAEEQNEVVNM